MTPVEILIERVNVLDTTATALIQSVQTVKVGLQASIDGAATSAVNANTYKLAAEQSAIAANLRANEAQSSVNLAATSAAATLVDKAATAADRVQTGLDKVATAADRVQTGLDKVATAADRVQTGLDKVATAADRVATGVDKGLTAADRVVTAADRAQTLIDKTASSNSASAAAGSAATVTAIYGTTNAFNAKLTEAAAQSQLAQTAAASASSILSQDLSAVSAALHRSPNAVTAMCIYDTALDSDGGAWVERMQHTSWMNESLCGAWLTGGFATELAARGDNLISYPETFENANWNKQAGATVTANATVAPDGTTTADKYDGVSTSNNGIFIYTGGMVAGSVRSASIHLKPVSGQWFKFLYYDGSTNAIQVWVDLLNGVLGSSSATGLGVLSGATITATGGGWYRITLSGVNGGSGEYVQLQAVTANSASSNANGSCHVWGAKLNQVGVLSSTYSASPELVSNGKFDNGTVGWTTGTLDAAVAGRLRILNDGTGTIASQSRQGFATVIGKTYAATADIIQNSGVVAAFQVGQIGASGQLGTVYGAAGQVVASKVVFIAQATTTYVFCGNNALAANLYSEFDNISVKEVTTLATPYVPYSTQTGSYYQSSADGKFYKLGATYGALTEVFRGNKAKFPRLAAIVAESGSVTIYDLTEPGRPMWMRFTGATAAYEMIGGSANSASVVAMQNGVLLVGLTATFGAVVVIKFASDSASRYRNNMQYTPICLNGVFNGNIAKRNASIGFNGATINFQIASDVTNAVAMTVLPDAPVDVATGLQVPTIAVATAGGVSVIKHDGTVVSITSATDSTNAACSRVRLTGTELSFFNIPHSSHGSNVIPATSVAVSGSLFNWFRKRYYYNNLVAGPSFLGDTGGASAGQSGHKNMAASALGVTRLKENLATPAKSIVSYIAPTYGTGGLLGDIRRAYLCNTEVESVSAPELVVNGTFDTDTAGWTASVGTGGALTWSAGAAMVVSSAVDAEALKQSIPTVIGKTYIVRGTCTALSHSVGFRFGNTFGANAAAAGAIPPVVFTATSTSTPLSVTLADANRTATVDNISVKEVIADRSYKTAAANIYGTLVKSPVA